VSPVPRHSPPLTRYTAVRRTPHVTLFPVDQLSRSFSRSLRRSCLLLARWRLLLAFWNLYVVIVVRVFLTLCLLLTLRAHCVFSLANSQFNHARHGIVSKMPGECRVKKKRRKAERRDACCCCSKVAARVTVEGEPEDTAAVGPPKYRPTTRERRVFPPTTGLVTLKIYSCAIGGVPIKFNAFLRLLNCPAPSARIQNGANDPGQPCKQPRLEPEPVLAALPAGRSTGPYAAQEHAIAEAQSLQCQFR